MTLVLTALLLALPVDARPNTVPADEDTSRPLVALHGASSRITATRYLRVTDAKEWRSLWLEHLGVTPGGLEDLAAEVPEIDFDRCMVIALFTGSRWNSRGISCEGIIERDAELLVRFDQLSYQTSGPDGGGEKVQPFGVFVLPRSECRVVLEENVQGLKDNPPKWKRQAEIPVLGSNKRED